MEFKGSAEEFDVARRYVEGQSGPVREATWDGTRKRRGEDRYWREQRKLAKAHVVAELGITPIMMLLWAWRVFQIVNWIISELKKRADE